MTDAFYKLPTVLILGALVLILAFLRRHHQTATFRLWLTAYLLIFLRFSLQVANTGFSLTSPFYLALDMVILQVSGVLFLVSVSSVADLPKRRAVLISSLSIPIALYSILAAFRFSASWWPYVICLAIVAMSSIAHARRALPWYWANVFTALAVIVAGIFVFAAFRGRVDFGYFAFLSGTYGFTAVLFLRKFRRNTPGVVATSIGFLLWATVAPVTYWLWNLPMGLPTIQNGIIDPYFVLALGLSNVPKFIVAVGMIVTLLESERLSVEAAQDRERVLSNQMRRFADVSSHLLTGVDVPSFCVEAAQLITEATNFQRVAILLTDAQHHMYVAGHSGVKADDVAKIEAGIAKATLETLQSLCKPENRVGANSYRTTTDQMEDMGAVWTDRRYDPNPNWKAGDEILVPLKSPRGSYLGMVSIDDPKDVDRVTPEDLAGVEMLAGDIAAAIENATLRMHLFQSEKLAGMGQLVAGVAHELNNPLTAVLGYSEMLADRISDATAQRDLEVLRREALRMKKIIANLQRFSRQQKLDRALVKLSSVVDDVIRLKRIDLLAQNIEIVNRMASGLPDIVANEALLNQLLMNVLNNAMDAVKDAQEKRILIEAEKVKDQIQLKVTDSGPGFKDENRVFDPFYTTKSTGKGTGLGLSICYGIVRDHGGDITATNLHPNGACIVIELPILPTTTAVIAAGSR